jgi:protein-L-isoaspartate(D-aspartate) O-methyltransferase
MLDTVSSRELRDRLAERITAHHRAVGLVLPAEIDQALRTVPRHLFTGDAALETAYEDAPIVTKRDGRGVAVSSVSAPWLQTLMLAQARLRPGDRVLEIGSGGYNAALIREVVGPSGWVTTVDVGHR